MTTITQMRAMQLTFAAAVTAIALFSAGRPVIPTDDTDFVNDSGQTSGDIFTQNAMDQGSA
jgi:hypothetical protein